MKAPAPDTVLDLGAGRGMLAIAAARRWCNARLVTVDIDHVPLVPASIERTGYSRLQHIHIKADALGNGLAERIGIPYGSVDAAVCNPPYVQIRWKPSYGRLLEEAGFEGALGTLTDVSADLLFLAQNLRFLRSGGQMGIIVPESLIAGQKSRIVRQRLIEQHRVNAVIQLPMGAFIGTEARAHIILLSKSVKSARVIKLYEFDQTGKLSSPVCIDAAQGEKRLDYAYFRWQHDVNNLGSAALRTVADYGASLRRGLLNSRQVKEATFPVFHTGDFPLDDQRYQLRLPQRSDSNPEACEISQVIAEPGDILLSRVGRRLHEQVCLVHSGRAAVSDCVYRLRVPRSYTSLVFESLNCSRGRSYLSSAAHGAAAKHLCRQDILDFLC
jgi:type I restriction enzyme M protein